MAISILVIIPEENFSLMFVINSSDMFDVIVDIGMLTLCFVRAKSLSHKSTFGFGTAVYNENPVVVLRPTGQNSFLELLIIF